MTQTISRTYHGVGFPGDSPFYTITLCYQPLLGRCYARYDYVRPSIADALPMFVEGGRRRCYRTGDHLDLRDAIIAGELHPALRAAECDGRHDRAVLGLLGHPASIVWESATTGVAVA